MGRSSFSKVRASGSEAPPNTTGRFQTGLVALEAEVKDSRLPDVWAFYEFGTAKSMREVAEPLSGQRVAGCIECHTKHTAVERTFVQFYPTLLEVARRMGTVKPGFRDVSDRSTFVGTPNENDERSNVRTTNDVQSLK